MAMRVRRLEQKSVNENTATANSDSSSCQRNENEPIDGVHGAWLHFWRARVRSVFSAAMCKIQASKR